MISKWLGFGIATFVLMILFISALKVYESYLGKKEMEIKLIEVPDVFPKYILEFREEIEPLKNMVNVLDSDRKLGKITELEYQRMLQDIDAKVTGFERRWKEELGNEN